MTVSVPFQSILKVHFSLEKYFSQALKFEEVCLSTLTYKYLKYESDEVPLPNVLHLQLFS